MMTFLNIYRSVGDDLDHADHVHEFMTVAAQHAGIMPVRVYIADITRETRDERMLALGASPRATALSARGHSSTPISH